MLIYDSYPDLLNDEWLAAYDLESCFTSGDPKGPISELDAAVALIRYSGNLKMSAKVLCRSRTQFRNFVLRNDMLAELFEEIEESFLDEVEDLHKTAALKGDLQTQRFFLTMKGAERGYVGKSKLDHSSTDGSMTPKSGMSDELITELEGLARRLASGNGKSQVADAGAVKSNNAAG